jgi:hypothetical protein
VTAVEVEAEEEVIWAREGHPAYNVEVVAVELLEDDDHANGSYDAAVAVAVAEDVLGDDVDEDGYQEAAIEPNANPCGPPLLASWGSHSDHGVQEHVLDNARSDLDNPVAAEQSHTTVEVSDRHDNDEDLLSNEGGSEGGGVGSVDAPDVEARHQGWVLVAAVDRNPNSAVRLVPSECILVCNGVEVLVARREDQRFHLIDWV